MTPTSPIGNFKVPYTPAAPVVAPQTPVAGKDRDGDNDASKVAEVEQPKATSGSVGTVINTTA